METYEIQTPFEPMAQGGQGYEGRYRFDKQMEVTQYHCHDYYELYIHLHGGQYMGVDNKLYLLKPNQVYIFPPFCMHGLSCTSEMKNYERAFLNVSPEVLKNLSCGQLDLNQFLQARASGGHHTYQLSDLDAERFVNCIRQIEAAQLRNGDAVDRFEDYTHMMILLNLLCQVIRRTVPVKDEGSSDSVIQDILTYINNHYTQSLRITDLARRFGVSESYLSHEFARFTNRSVYDYILYRRVTLARQLMLGADTLNTISYQCGFNDYSNFLRTFSKVVGMSPKQYRKQLNRFQNKELNQRPF
jgi:AraC-like DNA-binding protein